MSVLHAPLAVDEPPLLVLLPHCLERARQAQTRLLNAQTGSQNCITKCRLCLRIDADGMETTLMKGKFRVMLECVFHFTLSTNVELPSRVCFQCYSKVQGFYMYYQQVKANQIELERTINSIQSSRNDCNGTEPPWKDRQPGVLTTPSEKVWKASTLSAETTNSEADTSCKDKILYQASFHPFAKGHSKTDQMLDPCSKSAIHDDPFRSVDVDEHKDVFVDGILFVDCETKGEPTDGKGENAQSVENILESKTSRFVAKTRNKVPQPSEPNAPVQPDKAALTLKECPMCKNYFRYSDIRRHIIESHSLQQNVGLRREYMVSTNVPKS